MLGAISSGRALRVRLVFFSAFVGAFADCNRSKMVSMGLGLPGIHSRGNHLSIRRAFSPSRNKKPAPTRIMGSMGMTDSTSRGNGSGRFSCVSVSFVNLSSSSSTITPSPTYSRASIKDFALRNFTTAIRALRAVGSGLVVLRLIDSSIIFRCGSFFLSYVVAAEYNTNHESNFLSFIRNPCSILYTPALMAPAKKGCMTRADVLMLINIPSCNVARYESSSSCRGSMLLVVVVLVRLRLVFSGLVVACACARGAALRVRSCRAVPATGFCAVRAGFGASASSRCARCGGVCSLCVRCVALLIFAVACEFVVVGRLCVARGRCADQIWYDL